MSEGARIRQFFARAAPDQVSLVTRGLALRALTGVVMRTPVDTGRARGAWMTSLRAPRGGESGILDRGGGVAVSTGAATIAQHTGYVQIVLENNVPYIGRLEDGYSKQAPNGMTALTLSELGLGPGRE